MSSATLDSPVAPATGETATLRFPIGLPGFPDARAFRAEHWGGESSPFLRITCVDGPSASFVIMKPQVYFADYRPEINDDVLSLVGLDEADQASLWVILTLGARAEEATANPARPARGERRRRPRRAGGAARPALAPPHAVGPGKALIGS